MNPAERAGLTRREWLKGLATAGVGAALAGCAHTQTRLESPIGFLETDKGNPGSVWAENLKPGTSDWLLSKPTIDPNTKYRCPWIEGFCSRTSIRAGQRLKLFVSTNPESDFTVEIYRLGYYDGTG